MYFETWSDVLTMQGHGGYVWFCYGLFALVMGLNIVQVKLVKRRLLKQYKLQQDRRRSPNQ